MKIKASARVSVPGNWTAMGQNERRLEIARRLCDLAYALESGEASMDSVLNKNGNTTAVKVKG